MHARSQSIARGRYPPERLQISWAPDQNTVDAAASSLSVHLEFKYEYEMDMIDV